MKRVLFSLAAALALAVPSFAQVAQIGDKTYDSLAEFFVAFQSIPTGVPTTITLLADVEVDTQIVIPGGKDITLDLNGHTYTFNPTGDNNSYAFFLQQVNVSDPAVSLTIEDTSAEQTGTIKAIGKANACISATDAALTIHGGDEIGKRIGQSVAIARFRAPLRDDGYCVTKLPSLQASKLPLGTSPFGPSGLSPYPHPLRFRHFR